MVWLHLLPLKNRIICKDVNEFTAISVQKPLLKKKKADSNKFIDETKEGNEITFLVNSLDLHITSNNETELYNSMQTK